MKHRHLRETRAPAVATWLLQRFAAGPHSEAVAGDLAEQYRRGRPRAWYWRQTIGAIVTSLAAEAWQHTGLSLAVVAVGMALPRFYTFIVWPRAVARFDGLWYPHLIYSEWSWMAIDPWAYRLELYMVTSRLTWCALLAAVAWAMSRWRPRQRSLVVVLFAITQVGPCLPAWQVAVGDWLRAPANPLWFFSALWFSLFAFGAIPFSILFGGRMILLERGT
jgi:hypothetical protein